VPATVDHRVRAQAVCGCGLCGEWGKQIGSMQEPSLQAGRSVAERRCPPVAQSRATLACHPHMPILDALTFNAPNRKRMNGVSTSDNDLIGSTERGWRLTSTRHARLTRRACPFSLTSRNTTPGLSVSRRSCTT
jgi:hypothetical protein